MNVPATAARRLPAVRHRIRTRLLRVLFLLFAVVVVGIILQRARDVDWDAVLAALGDYHAGVLVTAALLALGAHGAAACYDLIGRHHVGYTLPAARVIAINGTAFAFSLNLGALVGGWGFRVRLYTRFGIGARTVMEIIALAVITNWSGFVLIAGVTLLLQPLPLPPSWQVDPAWLRAGGALLLAAVIAYLWLCHTASRRGRTLRLRGIVLKAPSLRLAVVQLAISSTSWLLMVAALYHLLPEPVPFAYVIIVLFASGIVGAALHVPGSLGVLEATVLQLLPTDMQQSQTLAAVLVFRALYYFLPFLIAAATYGALEIGARRNRSAASRG